MTTRPTADRVRQALFEILGPLSGGSVLDLYAGTGALGIEALSRGAARAVFVETHAAALAAIRRNLEELDLTREAAVLAVPVERAGRALRNIGPFDLVLFDPPWDALDPALKALERLLRPELLAPGARVVIEHPAERTVEAERFFDLQGSDVRRWGDTGATLLVKGEEGRRATPEQ